MKKIGFIGVGIMGKSMARNLMKAGFELNVFDRDKSKANGLIDEGAIVHDTIGGCVRDCDVVISIVGYPSDVEEIYFAPGNIFSNAKPGAYLIDMTTSSPDLAERLYKAGVSKGCHVMDAPVTGGDIGAKNGTLSILVGGDKADFESCMPVFQAMGTNIRYQGNAGSGQHAKLANQIMIAGTLSGVCEAFTYAKAKGLDLQNLVQSVATGAAGSKQLDTCGTKILADDYSPGFLLKHFVKDMGLALVEAEKSGIMLEILRQTLSNCRELESEGYGDLGTQALMKHYK